MGFLPLVRGLPTRLTDTESRGLKLFKNTRCTLVGWTLHPDEASEVEHGERRLQRQPEILYLKFAGKEWQIDDLEPGIYPLAPTKLQWLVNVETKISARREGFQVIPNAFQVHSLS